MWQELSIVTQLTRGAMDRETERVASSGRRQGVGSCTLEYCSSSSRGSAPSIRLVRRVKEVNLEIPDSRVCEGREE